VLPHIKRSREMRNAGRIVAFGIRSAACGNRRAATKADPTKEIGKGES
jgi:hypothetical protein